jgi:hypothetical protein
MPAVTESEGFWKVLKEADVLDRLSFPEPIEIITDRDQDRSISQFYLGTSSQDLQRSRDMGDVAFPLYGTDTGARHVYPLMIWTPPRLTVRP